MYTYGKEGYQELVDLRRKIKKQRERTIYAQARRRKAFVWNTAQGFAICVLGLATWQGYTYLYHAIINT